MKRQKATVRWFDNRSGEGMVRLQDGPCIYVHWSAIDVVRDRELQKPVKEVWGVLFSGQSVLVEVFEDYNWTQISWLGAA